jgi:hypothetical protein
MEKGGWGKKTQKTGYFSEENWEGGGPPYKPMCIYIYNVIIIIIIDSTAYYRP